MLPSFTIPTEKSMRVVCMLDRLDNSVVTSKSEDSAETGQINIFRLLFQLSGRVRTSSLQKLTMPFLGNYVFSSTGRTKDTTHSVQRKGSRQNEGWWVEGWQKEGAKPSVMLHEAHVAGARCSAEPLAIGYEELKDSDF